MASPYYRRDISSAFGGPLTKGVKYLIIINLVVFAIQLLFPPITGWLALQPTAVLGGFQIWRLVTWLFAHGSLMHILFNMLFLFMFGCQLERLWGTRFFVHYYFICGIGSGLFTFIPIAQFFYASHIGASGAIYGLLMAFGLLFPTATIYFMLLFPIQARYFVIILGLMTFYASISASPSGVSNAAHLGGLAVGFAYLRWGIRRQRMARPAEVGDSLRQAYRRWRLRRLRKKFESYYEKRSGGSRYDVH